MSIRSERIKLLVEQSNLSYQELEKKTGIKKSSLQRYASGVTSKIPIDVIERLSVVFNVSQEYLMGWSNNENREKTTPNVGNNILLLRKQLGLTQEELAKKMGYKTKSSINKIELGKNDIPQSKIVQFAEVLGTTPAFLMGWSENEGQEQPSPDKVELTEGEKVLLDLFRRVPEDEQSMLLRMIHAVLDNQEQ